jgi:hypothetical protein
VNSITLNERRFRFCDGMETKAAIGQERPVTIGKAGPKAAADNFLLKHVLLAYVF